MYYDCDNCAMLTDDKWINVQTREQREFGWTTNVTKTQLGIAKHAGVSIVLSREGGTRNCFSERNMAWIKNNTKVIFDAYDHGTLSSVTADLGSQKPTVPLC